MKAAPEQQQLLLQLQTHDHTLARLQHRYDRLPERDALPKLQHETGEAKTLFMAVQRELDTQNAEIARIESDVALVQHRIDRDRGLSAAGGSAKEMQAVQHELELLDRRRKELEDRQLEHMAAAEHIQRRYDEARNTLDAIEQRRVVALAALTDAQRDIDAESLRINAERTRLAAEVQPALLAHYEQLRARIGIGAARLRGNISEASNMELTPAELNGIVQAPADEIVYCPQSGAILVREANA